MARKSADALAREHTELAVDVLAQIMRDEFAKDGDRIKAADSILDRGHGKPLNATIALPMSKAHAARLVSMTDDELIQLVEAQPLPRLALPNPARSGEEPVDAAFTVAPERDPLLD